MKVIFVIVNTHNTDCTNTKCDSAINPSSSITWREVLMDNTLLMSTSVAALK